MVAQPLANRVTVVGNAHVTEVSRPAWTRVAGAIDAQARGDMLAAVAAFRLADRIDDDPTVASCVVMTLDMVSDDPDLVFGERDAFARRFCDPLTRAAPPHANSRDPERKLKVGYLSADFRGHSAASSILPAVRHHDRERFEAHLYMTGRAEDRLTGLFRGVAEGWHPVNALSEAQLADKIRSDGIDVLVDLSGFSQGHRILALARKPAPIQVVGWGASSMGTGILASDYVVTDAVATPPEHEYLYREKPLRLPCLLAFSPPPVMPPVGPPPLARNGYATFGCFGRPTKITDGALRAWAAILRRVPGSRLSLKNGEYADRRMCVRVLDALTALGVRPERVSFAGLTPTYDHQDAYNGVDVALDTWPENGGATVLDACLMGVPVVAKLGRLSTGRAASSILKAAGLCDPIEGTDAYVARAVRWANDPAFLAETRATGRARFLASPVADGPRYARAFEREVRRAWQAWCAA